jgi:hypothetical protein
VQSIRLVGRVKASGKNGKSFADAPHEFSTNIAEKSKKSTVAVFTSTHTHDQLKSKPSAAN